MSKSFPLSDRATLGLKKPEYKPAQIIHDPGNPHPLFGKDPNIMNAYGHTYYPKWIIVNGVQHIVKSKDHEQAVIAQFGRATDL
jgi:hypothetical protein